MNPEDFLKLMASQRLKGQSRWKFKYQAKEKTECKICHYFPLDKSELDWHRIEPLGEYTDDNVILLCKTCHNKIHKFIKAGVDFKIAILMLSIEQ